MVGGPAVAEVGVLEEPRRASPAHFTPHSTPVSTARLRGQKESEKTSYSYHVG